MKKVAIFEIDAVNIDRYFLDVFDGLQPELILIDSPDEFQLYKKSGKCRDRNVVCTAWGSPRKLLNLLRMHNIELLIVDAHRIPDCYIISLAHSLGISVLYVQHGMYIPFMRRTFSFFLSKSVKTLRYLYYSIALGLYMRSFNVIMAMFRIHVLGANRSILASYSELFPDKKFVFSKYWERWHTDHYSFPEGDFFHIGHPDFRKFQFGSELPPNCVAYCYQTLFEDGRISEGAWMCFLEDLIKWISKNQLILHVKAHPRMSKKIKEWFIKRGAIVSNFDIPNTEKVIGHYSSLLPFWGVSSREVYCVELDGHHIDESISSWSVVVSSLDDINFVHEKTDSIKCGEIFGTPLTASEIGKIVESL